MPGSIQIFANALNVSEKELFKMMEQGTIVSSEILPKVAKEFAKAARQGGALGEALKTVRVQQGKFLTQSQKAQNTIFKSGFGEGLSSFYQTMIRAFKDLDPVLKILGKTFKLLFSTVAEALNMLIQPIKVLGNLVDTLYDLDKTSSHFAENTTPKLVAAALLMSTAWGKVLVKFLAIKAIYEEIIGLTNKGVRGQLERDLGIDIGVGEAGGLFDPTAGNASLQRDASPVDNFFKKLNTGDTKDPLGDLRKNLGISAMGGSNVEVRVVNNPVIDHSGGMHIETAIEQSIVNGQAQR